MFDKVASQMGKQELESEKFLRKVFLAETFAVPAGADDKTAQLSTLYDDFAECRITYSEYQKAVSKITLEFYEEDYSNAYDNVYDEYPQPPDDQDDEDDTR